MHEFSSPPKRPLATINIVFLGFFQWLGVTRASNLPVLCGIRFRAVLILGHESAMGWLATLRTNKILL